MQGDPFIGRHIRYGGIILESLIGVGGMGRVYLGRDIILGRPVAVKVLHPELMNNPGLKSSFKAEATAATCLWHPNIIQIIDLCDEEDGTSCLIMEFAPGVTLADVIEKEYPLATPRIIRILDQILTGLQVAHDEGLIHRDLKPENIMLHDLPGNPDFVKILDFGVAKRMEQMSEFRESVAGTPHFMSPEQARGNKTDPRSDLYSVGVILYQTLTRLLPFNDSKDSVIDKVIHDEVIAPTKTFYGAYVDPDLEPICLKAMEKDPKNRYQSALLFREALLNLLTKRSNEEIQSLDSRKLSTSHPISSISLNQSCTNVAVLARYLRFSSPLTPEDEFKILNETRLSFEKITQESGGYFSNHLGNLSTSFFGAEVSPVEGSKQAINAANALVDTQNFNQTQYSQHFGIAAGDLIIRGDYPLVHGLALEKAIDLSKSALAEETRVDENIVKYASGSRFQILESDGHAYKLLPASVEETCELKQELYIPILGHEEELAVLYKTFDTMVGKQSPCRLAITGDNGIGKSRMLNFIERHARTREIPVFRVRSERFITSRPAYTLARIISLVFESYKNNPPISITSLKALNHLLSPSPDAQNCSQNWLDSLTVATHELFFSINEPYIIICENYDYIDAVSYAVLDHVSQKLKQFCNIFVDGDNSSELIKTFIEDGQELHLQPLSTHAIVEFLHLNFPSLADKYIQQAAALTQGNPCHLRLVVDFLVDKQAYANPFIPNSIPDLLIFELEKIPELARRVLAMAATLGRQFPLDVLFEACPKTWNISQAISVLQKNRFLLRKKISGESWLEFRSQDLLNVAASQLSDLAILNIHQRFANYYMKLKQQSSENLFQLARHFALSKDYAKAYPCFSLAAQIAYQDFGPDATIPIINTMIDITHKIEDPRPFAEHIFNISLLLILTQHPDEAHSFLQILRPLPPSDEFYKQQILLAASAPSTTSPNRILHRLKMALDSNLDSPHYRAFAAYYKALQEKKLNTPYAALHSIQSVSNIIENQSENFPPIFRTIIWVGHFLHIQILLSVDLVQQAEARLKVLLNTYEPYTLAHTRFAFSIIKLQNISNPSEKLEKLENVLSQAVECSDFPTQIAILAETAELLKESDPEEATQRLKKAIELSSLMDFYGIKQQLLRDFHKVISTF